MRKSACVHLCVCRCMRHPDRISSVIYIYIYVYIYQTIYIYIYIKRVRVCVWMPITRTHSLSLSLSQAHIHRHTHTLSQTNKLTLPRPRPHKQTHIHEHKYTDLIIPGWCIFTGQRCSRTTRPPSRQNFYLTLWHQRTYFPRNIQLLYTPETVSLLIV